MECMWINQPSGLQPYHKLHGTKVLVLESDIAHARTGPNELVTVYFINRDIFSQKVSLGALAYGWPEEVEKTPEEGRVSVIQKKTVYVVGDKTFDTEEKAQGEIVGLILLWMDNYHPNIGAERRMSLAKYIVENRKALQELLEF